MPASFGSQEDLKVRLAAELIHGDLRVAGGQVEVSRLRKRAGNPRQAEKRGGKEAGATHVAVSVET